MDRQRTVLEAVRNEQPSATIGMRAEGSVAGDSRQAAGARGRAVVGRFPTLEIGDVVSCPFLGALVPPDQPFAIGPRPALGISRRPVIHDATIFGPGPSPLSIHGIP